MKKMFFLLFSGVLFTGALQADTSLLDSFQRESFPSNALRYYTYGTVQTMGEYPMLGTGLRLTKGAHNLDLLGSVLPLNKFNPVVFHGKIQYLMCPLQYGFYLGGGVGVLKAPTAVEGIKPSSEWTLGYEWTRGNNKRIFLEGNATVPFLNEETITLPGLSFGLGF